MLYLLDTNIISDLVKNGRQSRVLAPIATVGAENCCTSAIVEAEINYGVDKKGSERLAAAVVGVMRRLPVHPFDQAAASAYGRLRWDLERKGQAIGSNDLLIAAHALALSAVLVTANIREFERVPGLRLGNWLTAAPHGEPSGR